MQAVNGCQLPPDAAAAHVAALAQLTPDPAARQSLAEAILASCGQQLAVALQQQSTAAMTVAATAAFTIGEVSPTLPLSWGTGSSMIAAAQCKPWRVQTCTPPLPRSFPLTSGTNKCNDEA